MCDLLRRRTLGIENRRYSVFSLLSVTHFITQSFIRMHSKTLSFAALATVVSSASAKSLADVLAATPSLSTITGTISSLPDLRRTLANASNITLLAPTNDAMAEFFMANPRPLYSTPRDLTALLEYHLLNGTYSSSAITPTPRLLHTLLTDYSSRGDTNPDGIVVEAETVGDNVTFTSGFDQNSSVITAVRLFSHFDCLFPLKVKAGPMQADLPLDFANAT